MPIVALAQTVPPISPFIFRNAGGLITPLFTSSTVVVGATASTTASKLQTPSLTITGIGVAGNPCLTTDVNGVISTQSCAGASSTGITSLNNQTGPAVTIAAGSNVTVTNTTNTITIASTGGGGSGSVSTSSAITAGYFPYWFNTTGGLTGTSTVFFSSDKVGIGTTVPSSTLHVVGTFQVSASTTLNALTASTVPYLDASKILQSSAVTPTELGYLSGVTSAIQTQLGTKVPTTRAVNTTSPLGGGGALSGDLTLTCSTCALTGTTISAGTGLTGGGDLSTNRTISLSVPVSVANGGTATTTQPTDLQVLVGATPSWKTLTGSTNLVVSTSTSAITLTPTGLALSSVTISAGTGLTGGGDLTTNRTISLSTPVSLANGGTNANITATNNRLFYSTASAGALSGSDLTYTVGSQLLTSASTTVTGFLTIPTSGTLNTSGQIKVNATTSTLVYYDGTAERGLTGGDCNIYYDFGTSGNQAFTALVTPRAVFSTSTITSVYAVHGTNGDTATFNLFLTNNRSTATSSMRSVFSSYQTVTATTTPATLTVNGSSTINMDDMILINTSAASTTDFGVGICKRVNP